MQFLSVHILLLISFSHMNYLLLCFLLLMSNDVDDDDVFSPTDLYTTLSQDPVKKKEATFGSLETTSHLLFTVTDDQ